MARTILLFHTISVRPSKQPQIMEYVPSPKVFDGLILKKNNKQHDHHLTRSPDASDAITGGIPMRCWSVNIPPAPGRHMLIATLSGALNRRRTGMATWANGLATFAAAHPSLLLLLHRIRPLACLRAPGPV